MNMKQKIEPKPPVIITNKRIPDCSGCGCVRYDWVGHGYMGCHKVGCNMDSKDAEMALMVEYEEVRFG